MQLAEGCLTAVIVGYQNIKKQTNICSVFFCKVEAMVVLESFYLFIAIAFLSLLLVVVVIVTLLFSNCGAIKLSLQ